MDHEKFKVKLNEAKYRIVYKVSKINLGYGKAHNENFQTITINNKTWFFAVNPDISFTGKSLHKFINYIIENKNIVCAAPLIYLPNNEIQYSAKKNPTFLSLLSSRFSILQNFKFIKNHLYKNQNRFIDYESEIIKAPFLSGCFLAFPSETYFKIKGFNKEIFLHFEDADIVRRCSLIGDTIHCPLGYVIHVRGRGSHNSITQQLALIKSYFFYIKCWGLQIK